jgi:hypothetical protein
MDFKGLIRTVDRQVCHRLNSNKGTKSDIEIAPAERSLGQIQFVLF